MAITASEGIFVYSSFSFLLVNPRDSWAALQNQVQASALAKGSCSVSGSWTPQLPACSRGRTGYLWSHGSHQKEPHSSQVFCLPLGELFSPEERQAGGVPRLLCLPSDHSPSFCSPFWSQTKTTHRVHHPRQLTIVKGRDGAHGEDRRGPLDPRETLLQVGRGSVLP